MRAVGRRLRRRPTPGPDALKVVTTTTVFADIVQNVGGSRVAATSIIPPGVGPEDYEPKPDDAGSSPTPRSSSRTASASTTSSIDLLASGTGGQTPHLVLGEGIPTLTVDGEENPHFWLDPTLVKRYYLPAIAAALTEIDPEGKATYDANVASYGAQLDTLDAELKAQVDTIPEANRKLVTFHDAFPYFAQHYGFELVGRDPREPGPGTVGGRPRRPRRQGQGRRGQGGVQRSAVQPEAGRDPRAGGRGSRTWSRPSTTTPWAGRRPTRTWA